MSMLTKTELFKVDDWFLAIISFNCKDDIFQCFVKKTIEPLNDSNFCKDIHFSLFGI